MPPGNVALETEFPPLLPHGVSLHVTRVFRSDTDVTVDGLMEMRDNAQRAAQLIGRINPDAVIYGCTSGSALGGTAANDELTRTIEAEVRAPVVTTATAVVSALKALNARTIFLVTPYVEELAEAEERFLREEGLEVRFSSSIRKRTSEEIRSVPPSEIAQLVLRDKEKAMRSDAVLVSCTNLHVLGIIKMLEEELGVPVVTSNQAALWAGLRLLEMRPRDRGALGSLFSDFDRAPVPSEGPSTPDLR